MRRRTQSSAWLALAAGAIVIAVVASRRGVAKARPALPARDYSDRSGLPLGIEASRGLARDAVIPADMRTPEPLRPFA